MKKSVFFFLFVSIVAIGCSKSRKEKHISDGVWIVKEYRVNGVDSTASVLYPTIKGYKFILDGSPEDRKNNYTFDRMYAVTTDGQEVNFGHWGERDNHKMMLTPEYAHIENIPSRPFIHCGCFPNYDIEYVKKEEMSYSLEYDGTTYNLIFENQ